jgi:sugar lactone lactonase YvrE
LQTKEFLESGKAEVMDEAPDTDLHAAQTMPHQNLERSEALELAEAVFEPAIEGAAGIYGELEVEKFISNYAAIVPPSALPEHNAEPESESLLEDANAAIILESSQPLRTEDADGDEEAVDLELDHSEGELQPANPLAEVGIPEQLGEGISLFASEVHMTLPEAPAGRVATNSNGEFAFYPEVAKDTDLIVAPTPQGVESMVDLRSSEASMETTYHLELPPGAILRPTAEAGAEVVKGGEVLVAIPPPTAIDAAGNPVQTELTVSNDTVNVVTNPNPSTAFPVLVDPEVVEMVESHHWIYYGERFDGWSSSTSNATVIQPYQHQVWGSDYPGLDLSAGVGGWTSTGAEANWTWWVPRYNQDINQFHEAPSTWVYEMVEEGVFFMPYGNSANYPATVYGLVDPSKGWQAVAVHYGGEGEINNWGNRFSQTNLSQQEGTKGADMELFTPEAEYPAKRRDAYDSTSFIYYVDQDTPELSALKPPSHWINETAEPISYEAQDKGIGIRQIWTEYGSEQLGFSQIGSCGMEVEPCPRKVTQSTLPIPYNPKWLPTGNDWVTVSVADAAYRGGSLATPNHKFSGKVLLRVDHTAPEVQLSGSLTEQGTVGTRRPRYDLRVTAKDGTEASPQSGIKRVEIKVDGKKIPMAEEAEWEPNCPTEDCHVNGEWTMNASEFGAGSHEVQVIATDAVNDVATKTLHVEIQPPAPELALSGSLTEEESLGTELPTYSLKVDAKALAESPVPAAIPTYSSSIGTSGSGNGQFSRPGSMGMSPAGNLVVPDTANNRIETFTPAGEFGFQFGTKGAGNGQLDRPTAVAVNANGNYWVTDSGNRRIEEFASGTGAFLRSVGSTGTGNGQFHGSGAAGPEAIAIDYHGNIWVADTYGGRLEKFSETGQFIRSVGSPGKGPGQLGQPVGIAIAPGGNVFVADWEDDKVVEYGEGGAFIRQFGSHGNGAGQLENPTGIGIDSRGDVWVADEKNERIEEFNQGGEYLGSFGSGGSGGGQFKLSYPTGIVSDTKGDIWVTDTGDNRIEKWVSANYATSITPTFLRSFGSAGTTGCHFSAVDGVAVGAGGDVWTVDRTLNLLQKWGPNGECLATYPTAGTAATPWNQPVGLAISGGHIWVSDIGTDHLVEITESDSLISAFGTSGSAPGDLDAPYGIGFDSNHHLWVPEFEGNRVQEFTEGGSLIRTVGSKGTSLGHFERPTGIAVGPGNKIWVSDFGNNRVEELTEGGSFIGEIGGSGSGLGQLLEPMGIYVDPAEHVWVADRGHNRVVEFTAAGEYLGQFGLPGTGPGDFEKAQFIAADATGHFWITDPVDERVNEWTVPKPHSQISTEITVDGKRVKPEEKACEAETCGSTIESTLQVSDYGPGRHNVVVRATDGLGNTTSKTYEIGDTTKPTLEVGGELIAAPEGWIEQAEGNYGLHATATDSGFGVTSLAFYLDGKAVASDPQSCPAGGCSASIVTTVNARGLTAGAHPAEVVATDGAGNFTTRKWTVNVDPEGSISTEEAEDTAAALEETGGVPVLAPTEEIPGIAGTTVGVGLTEKSEEPGVFLSTGSYVPQEVAGTAGEGFKFYASGLAALTVACDEVEEPDEEECVPREALEAAQEQEEEEIAAGFKHPGMISITVIPRGAANPEEEVSLVNGESAVSPNAGGEEADTFTRPMSDGGLSFADIRGPEAPEHYTYEMELGPELHLRQPDPQHVEVFYWKYDVTAFVITAEAAHDVIGTAVPTHLSISGPEKITLTVEHRGASPAGGGFVYPVMGGAGWQGGYSVFGFEMNEPPPGEESRAGEAEETVIGPPEPSTPQAAGVTELAMLGKAARSTTRHRIRWIRCQHRWEPAPYSSSSRNTEHPCGNPFTREESDEEFAFNFGIASYIYVSPGNFVRHGPGDGADVECAQELFPSHWNGVLVEVPWFINPAEQCQWRPSSNGNGGEEVGPGHHLCLYGEWNAGEWSSGAWQTFQVGSAVWIESIHGGEGYEVSRHKTTLYKCNS